METAESLQLCVSLSSQSHKIGELSRQVQQPTTQVNQLAEGLSQLAMQPKPVTAAVFTPAPIIPKPNMLWVFGLMPAVLRCTPSDL